MSVLLPNASLGLRRRREGAYNAHGEATGAGYDDLEGPHPGRTKPRSDGGWDLGVDPSLWPVREDDLIVADTGEEWLVRSAALLTNNYDSTVNWVRVDAQRRVTGGSQPVDPWFVGR